MNATATMIDTGSDGRNWFTVSLDGTTEIFGMTAEGAMLDADGCTVTDFANARNIAARNAIQAAQ